MNNPKTILCIDDEESILNFLKVIFSRRGIDYIGVKTNKEAFKIIERREESREKIEVIISDLIKPESDGFEFINELRKKHNSKKRIIIYSGTTPQNIEPEKMEELIKGNIFSWIKKGRESLQPLVKSVKNSFESYKKPTHKRIYLFCGATSSGKSTLINQALSNFDYLEPLPKFTTRAKRIYENPTFSEYTVHLNKKEFLKLKQKDFFAFTNLRNEDHYGYPKMYFDKISEGENDYVMDTGNLNTALQIKNLYPQTKLILVLSNFYQNLNRLILRAESIQIPKNCSYNFDSDLTKRVKGLEEKLDWFIKNEKNFDLILDNTYYQDSVRDLSDFISFHRNQEGGKYKQKRIIQL